MTRAGSVLILGARRDQLPVFSAARGRGLSVATIDPDPDAPGMAVADRSLVADLADDAACEAFARSVRPSAVLTFAADYPVPMVARLAEAHGLAGLSEQAVPAVTDKLAMRQALAEAGVAVPRWQHVCSEAQARSAVARIGGDVVVKPRRSSGSRGVAAVSPEEVSLLGQAFEAASAMDDEEGVLIEQLIAGPEVSVEAVAVDGVVMIVARTDKVTTGRPHFVETGHCQPADVSDCEAHVLDDTVRRAVLALGLDRTVTHTELRLTPDGPVVMEIAARAAGGTIAADLTPLSTGIDLAELALALALGEHPTIEHRRCGGSAVRYFTPDAGTVITVAGLERARELPGVERIDLWIEPGAVIDRLEDARHRVGRVITFGPDREAALYRAATAVAEVDIEVAA